MTTADLTLDFVETSLPRPLPPVTSMFSRPFWDGLQQGRLLTTRCDGCKEPSFPPRDYCPRCGSPGHEWIGLGGKGRLYSKTRIHAAGGSFAAMTPYSVGLVDLDDGLRLLARLLPSASALPLDSPVVLVVLRHPDGCLIGARAITA